MASQLVVAARDTVILLGALSELCWLSVTPHLLWLIHPRMETFDQVGLITPSFLGPHTSDGDMRGVVTL